MTGITEASAPVIPIRYSVRLFCFPPMPDIPCLLIIQRRDDLGQRAEKIPVEVHRQKL